LKTKLEILKVRYDEFKKETNYKKDAMEQNMYHNYELKELEIKVKPYQEKIDLYNSINKTKLEEINKLTERRQALKIGETDDAQMMKEKINIIKNQILDVMGKENTLPVNVVIDEAKVHLEKMAEENINFDCETKQMMKPLEENIQKEETKMLRSEASKTRLKTLLSSLENREKAK
jgi:hypothetical protein